MSFNQFRQKNSLPLAVFSDGTDLKSFVFSIKPEAPRPGIFSTIKNKINDRRY